jgi:subtilisin family serine protease
MKKYLSCLVTLSVLMIMSCKKDKADNSVDEPEFITPYKAPDTANAQPGIYMVTYKESFIKPYCDIYSGSNTIRDAKLAGAVAYERDQKLIINDRLRNPDGSYIVDPQNIIYYYSTLVVGFVAPMDKAAVKKFVEDPMVEYIEKQEMVKMIEDEPTHTGTVTKGGGPQFIDDLRYQMGYKYPGSEDYYVWILDTGCDPDHPDLNVKVPFGASFMPGDPNLEDYHGHGTRVAGVLGAKNNTYGTRGIAPGAPIVPIKVLNNAAEGTPAIVTKGLEYIWQHSVKNDVINMSLSIYVANNNVVSVSAMEAAVRKFYPWDIWIAAAAGNKYNHATNFSPARLSSPNHAWHAEMRSFFYVISSYGKDYYFSSSFSNYGTAIDFAGPGEELYSTDKYGGYINNIWGTSFASPVVAGILLLNNGVIKNSWKVKNDKDSNPDRVAWLF